MRPQRRSTFVTVEQVVLLKRCWNTLIRIFIPPESIIIPPNPHAASLENKTSGSTPIVLEEFRKQTLYCMPPNIPSRVQSG